VLKPAKPKLSLWNNKGRTITEKNDKTPCYLVIGTHLTHESPIVGSTPRSRNFSDILLLPLGNSPIVTVESSALYLHELHDHKTRQKQLSIMYISLLQSFTSGCRISQ